MADPQLLQRAQLLQKAKMIQSQKLAENPAAFPGVDAIGVTDGPTPAGQDVTQASEDFDPTGVTMGTLGTAAKLLDVPRGALTGPALAALLKGVTGKDAATMKDWGNAVNPTNLSTFPSSGEMFERVGVPEGAKMSDYMEVYADPEEENPWYQPEKGGMLDFTLRGAGGFGTDVAIDPLTYISLGASSVAKKVAQSASKSALEAAAKKGIGTKILESVGKPIEKGISKIAMPVAETVNKMPGGKLLTDIATAPSQGLKKVGKKIYDSTIQAVEHEGDKFGKKEVGETLYNARIKTPFGLRDKGAAATDTLINARNKILDDAGQQGAKVQMADSMSATEKEIQKLRNIKDTDAQKLADDLEAKIAEYKLTESGTPDIPDRTVMERAEIGKTAYGQPKMGDVKRVIPGKKGKAPAPYSPKEATELKTFLYSNLPTSTFQQNLNAPVSARIKSAMSKGVKEGVEDSVGRTLGPQAGADLAELNAEAGKLLSTRKAQTRVANNYDRLANNATSLTGTDTVLGGLGAMAHGEVGGGLQAIALKKLLDGLRIGTMPMGYGVRKVGEGALSGPAVDILTRQKFKETAGRGSEKERRKRGNEEE